MPVGALAGTPSDWARRRHSVGLNPKAALKDRKELAPGAISRFARRSRQGFHQNFAGAIGLQQTHFRSLRSGGLANVVRNNRLKWRVVQPHNRANSAGVCAISTTSVITETAVEIDRQLSVLPLVTPGART